MPRGEAQTGRELRSIPGVGPSVAQDLVDLGILAVRDLDGRDPQALYDRLCEMRGARIDRCMLYVLRCAVYYASHDRHDPELLKWWSWKSAPVAASPKAAQSIRSAESSSRRSSLPR